MPISIRDAAPSDLTAILALERTVSTAAHWSVDQYQRCIEQGNVIIAEQESRICGFLCTRVVVGEWEIENVVVELDFRRQGIGAALMREVAKRWEASAGTAILLEVRDSNVTARALYEKCGLSQVGRRSAYYSDPIEDAVLYALRREKRPYG